MSDQPLSWRKYFGVHPAANLMPRNGAAEQHALAEDIENHGIKSPITLFQPANGNPPDVIDGTSRLDAAEAKGIETVGPDGALLVPFVTVHEAEGIDPYALVISLNVHRRHLTRAQRKQLIRELNTQQPELSTRALADLTKTSKSAVHRALAAEEPAGAPNGAPPEAVAEVAKPDPSSQGKPESQVGSPAARVTGRDGKSYPRRIKQTTKAVSREKPRPTRAHMRSRTVAGLVTLLKQELVPTLDDLVRLLKDSEPRIAQISPEKRHELARGYIKALGVSPDDLCSHPLRVERSDTAPEDQIPLQPPTVAPGDVSQRLSHAVEPS